MCTVLKLKYLITVRGLEEQSKLFQGKLPHVTRPIRQAAAHDKGGSEPEAVC